MAQSLNRRSGRHHGDLRNALEAAALELVREQGVANFSLAEASRRAGVSVAAPFKHYAGKDALLAALALRAYTEQQYRFASAIGAVGNPVEQMGEFAAAYVRFTIDQPALFQIAFGSGIDKRAYPELEHAGSRVLEVLMAPALQLVSDQANALALVHAVGALAHGYAAFLREGVFGLGSNADQNAVEGARLAAQKLTSSLAGRIS